MNLHEAQSSTPLQLVNQLFAQGGFVCPVEVIIEEGKEVEISELTDYEKAMLLARNQTSDKFNEMVKNHEDSEESDNDTPAIMEKLSDQKKLVKFLDDLFWLSVRSRLNGVANSEIGIRADWKIVNVIKTDDEDCDNCDAKEGCLVFLMKASMA